MQKQKSRTFYKIEQSPLYKLTNKRKLSELLGVQINVISKFSKDSPELYKIWIDNKGKKPRQIESPEKDLKRMQKRLTKYLSRIEPPSWLFSGTKTRSYISNASIYSLNNYVAKIDISEFYRSCDKEYVFKFFKAKLLQSDDIAWILTHISVYNNYIPTGAPSSQLVAFWAYYECFDEIVKVGEHFGIKASLYVDDITFSSQTQISTDFIFRVTKILKKYNLSVKKTKTKYYGKKDNKLITGVIITPHHEIRIANKLRRKIITTADSLFSSNKMDIPTFNSLFGMLKSARQIEKNAFGNLYNRMIKINKRITTP